MRLRTYKTEAVVLKQMPLGEADRILSLFTPDEGKVRAVAKGVRRTKSRLAGHVEPLNQVSVSLYHGRNLDVVTEAQAIRSFRPIREDLGRLSKAIYLADLVDSFSAEQAPNLPVYGLLVTALERLEDATQPDLLLRHFEMHLLDHSGYRPQLQHCVECSDQLDPGDHMLSCAKGGVLCPACRTDSGAGLVPVSLGAMKVLRFLQREVDYRKVDGLTLSDAVSAQIERVLRTYIRFLIEREVKSAEFMRLVSSQGARR